MANAPIGAPNLVVANPAVQAPAAPAPAAPAADAGLAGNNDIAGIVADLNAALNGGGMKSQAELADLLERVLAAMSGKTGDTTSKKSGLSDLPNSSANFMSGPLSTGDPGMDAHHQQVYDSSIASGQSPEQAMSTVQSDPLIFDLSGDGKTDATVDQHGVEVDGSTDTKWAAKGDGVLAFGDSPLDTEGGKYKDAYANLADKAKAAGIDTSKGYLDAADLQKLEAQGLTMMVSNGDGTNTSKTPTELGITRIDLKVQATNKQDSEGNTVAAEGTFVRNGKTERAADVWLNNIPKK